MRKKSEVRLVYYIYIYIYIYVGTLGMYVCISPRGEGGRVVMKSGPHDQKSYLLERSLVFLFSFFFFFVFTFYLTYVYVKIVSLLECIIFLCFSFFSIPVRLS